MLWEFHQNDRSVREVLKRGNRYRLVELLELDGGKTEEAESNQMIFSLGNDAQIDGIGMIDSPTKLVFSKTDLGGTELPGAQIEILDPVSYTHLDVYKRQVRSQIIFRRIQR